MTLQKIAQTVGVSVGTAHAATSDLFNSEKVTGADGKTYPTTYRKREEDNQNTCRTSLDPVTEIEDLRVSDRLWKEAMEELQPDEPDTPSDSSP